MFQRLFWIHHIEERWKERPIVWLTGVRRTGKTTLAQSLPKTRYFDCERPSAAGPMNRDPEACLEFQGNGRLVLDEIHRLEDPARLRKLAHDHYPRLQILAIG